MGAELVPFTFRGHQVRTLSINGDPWWVANDACGALEIADARSSLRFLDEDEKGVHTVHTPGGDQQVSIINEPGLYSLILRSRKPQAKAFKRWITHEVIPSIRKTGRYEAAPAQESTNLPDLATYEGKVVLLDMLRDQVERTRALELENAQQQQELDETHAYVDHIEPKAEAYDTIIENHTDDYDAREAVAFLNREPRITIGPRVLLRKLREWKLVDTWDKPYSAHKTHVRLKPQFFKDPHTEEEREGRPQVRITKLGLSYIRRRLLDELDERGVRDAELPGLFDQPSNVTRLPARRGISGPAGGVLPPPGA